MMGKYNALPIVEVYQPYRKGVVMNTKICNKCKTEKPTSEYYTHITNKDKLNSTCKECCRLYRKQHAKDLKDGKVVPVLPASPDATTRVCLQCKKTKPLEGFHRQTLGENGRRSTCIECRKAAWTKPPKPKIQEKPGHKTCFSCGESKPHSEFYKHPKGVQGLSSDCRICHSRKGSQWTRNNRDRKNAAKSRRRTRVSIQMTAEDKDQSLMKRKEIKNDACYYCGQASRQMTDDHFYPLAKGGTDHAWNIVRACASCNFSKGAKCGTCFMGTPCWSECSPQLLEVL